MSKIITKEMRDYFSELKETFIEPAKDLNPIISGGCIRDTLLKKTVKDIDIFMSERAILDYLSLFGKTKKDCRTTWYSDNKKARDNYENADIVGTYELLLSNDFNEFNVNIITMRDNFDAKEICDRHAFGICKCSLSKDGLYLSEEFKEDFYNKQMTLYRTNWGHEQTLKYFMRLYPKLGLPMVMEKRV